MKKSFSKKFLLPEALCLRLQTQFGQGNFSSILTSFEKRRLPSVRVNTLKTTEEYIKQYFKQHQIQFKNVLGLPYAFSIQNKTLQYLLTCEHIKNGFLYLQSIASQIPVFVLDPKPGETILDLCAAPGSKTSQIAACMQNRGNIIAYEKDEIRFQKLLFTLKQQGVNIAHAQQKDATYCEEYSQEQFDRVLADVPCSAEGRICLQEPRSYRFWSQNKSKLHLNIQRRLLRAAVHRLKTGGTLVYSTCTLSPLENEEMMAWLLKTYPSLQPVHISISLSRLWRAKPTGVYLLPDQIHEGFFVAKFLKKSSLSTYIGSH